MKIKTHILKPMRHYESSAKKKVHSTNCPIKKMEKAHIGHLTVHLKALEKKKQTHPVGVEDWK